jgi:hypothetical protein
MGIGSAIGGIIGIAVGGFMLAATLPGTLDAINAANTTGWTAMQVAIYPLVGLIILFAAILSILKSAGMGM